MKHQGAYVNRRNFIRTTATLATGITGFSLLPGQAFANTANTIGSMLLHLAATERQYQIHTFEEKPYHDWYLGDAKVDWKSAMLLGEDGRKNIKGNNLKYYTDILTEVRAKTEAEFKKRDDSWLAKTDPSFFMKQPTNNFCKWFHVCEHESNHNGQMKWIKSRLPGAKSGND